MEIKIPIQKSIKLCFEQPTSKTGRVLNLLTNNRSYRFAAGLAPFRLLLIIPEIIYIADLIASVRQDFSVGLLKFLRNERQPMPMLSPV